jgi:outer membrane lipoprotein SlyB
VKINSSRWVLLAGLMVALAALSGCETAPPYQGSTAYGPPPNVCTTCGVVQSIQQVYVQQQGTNNSGIGTVIGAVAGGILGSTIGHGRGNTAATVGGAVIGGVVGNQVGAANSTPGGTSVAWQVVIRLDNGQYATVTQMPNPGVRPGDYVYINNNLVYPR